MSDTEHYVRDDVRGFLDMLEQLGRPGVEEVGHIEGRTAMKAMGAIAELDAPDIAVKRDLTCPGTDANDGHDVPLRLYDARESREPSPAIVFIHGGGFVIGDIEVYDSLCAHIAVEMDLPVVSVEYRLAPEHPFPAAPDDCEVAARWIASSPAELGREVTGLIPMGDSAGGNLTIVVTNQLAAQPADVPVVLQVPIYPVASDVSKHKSLSDFFDGYLLTGAAMAWFTEQYRGDAADPRHTPIVGDCSNTPPTVICTSGLDPLRDSGREYAAHLIQLGTDITYLEFAGNIHGFITLRKAIPSGQADFARLLAACKTMLGRGL